MLSIPPFAHIQVIEETAKHARTSRYEREVEDLLREAAFARQAVMVAEPPAPKRGLQRLVLNLRAFLF